MRWQNSLLNHCFLSKQLLGTGKKWRNNALGSKKEPCWIDGCQRLHLLITIFFHLCWSRSRVDELCWGTFYGWGFFVTITHNQSLCAAWTPCQGWEGMRLPWVGVLPRCHWNFLSEERRVVINVWGCVRSISETLLAQKTSQEVNLAINLAAFTPVKPLFQSAT